MWLDKDIEDYVDRPLKAIFKALDDELASIDARKIKTPKVEISYKDYTQWYEPLESYF